MSAEVKPSMDEITHVTVVPDDRDIRDYRRGDIGQPLLAVDDDRWILCCPMCGNVTTRYPFEMIVKHADGTVSTTPPLLHCHGRYVFRRYRIEHNHVWWVE